MRVLTQLGYSFIFQVSCKCLLLSHGVLETLSKTSLLGHSSRTICSPANCRMNPDNRCACTIRFMFGLDQRAWLMQWHTWQSAGGAHILEMKEQRTRNLKLIEYDDFSGILQAVCFSNSPTAEQAS